MTVPEDLAARFWRRVTRGEGCWLWGGATRNGYGKLRVNYTFRYAHHVAWRLTYGVWPDMLRHDCDTPLCVKPAHLRTGTVADNNRDREERQRTSRGAAHYNAKLTAEKAAEIRRLRAVGTSYNILGEMFGVDSKTAWQVCNGTRWRSAL